MSELPHNELRTRGESGQRGTIHRGVEDELGLRTSLAFHSLFRLTRSQEAGRSFNLGTTFSSSLGEATESLRAGRGVFHSVFRRYRDGTARSLDRSLLPLPPSVAGGGAVLEERAFEPRDPAAPCTLRYALWQDGKRRELSRDQYVSLTIQRDVAVLAASGIVATRRPDGRFDVRRKNVEGWTAIPTKPGAPRGYLSPDRKFIFREGHDARGYGGKRVYERATVTAQRRELELANGQFGGSLFPETINLMLK